MLCNISPSPFHSLIPPALTATAAKMQRQLVMIAGTKRKPVTSGIPYGNFQDIAKPNFLKTFFFQFCRLDSGFQIRPFYNPILTNKLFFII